MKKIIFLTIITILSISCSNTETKNNEQLATVEQYSSTVYICTGAYATKYHRSSYCSGLNNCKGDVVAISINEIGNRSACQKCC